MTEQEWMESQDPRPILEHLRGKTEDRKVKLFLHACNSLILPFAEQRVVDGWKARDRHFDVGDWEIHDATIAVEEITKYAGTRVARTIRASPKEQLATFNRFRKEQWEHQADAIRDIFGNPFRPVTLDAAWLTPTVTKLAILIYEERQFDKMPLLGDALEEAGCSNEDMLQHCRGGGEHVRGCWVVDKVLGKE